MEPASNGEYFLLDNAIACSGDSEFIYLDGGANIGSNVDYLEAKSISDNKALRIIAVEAISDTFKKLVGVERLPSTVCLNAALGSTRGSVEFFVDTASPGSGANSVYQHYYLRGAGRQTVAQTTIDEIAKAQGLARVNFIKLDIEGSELEALKGARGLIGDGLVDFIQMEYNQTWIAARVSLHDVFEFFEPYQYQLYKVIPRGLLRMGSYHYTLDDFYFSNILAVRPGCPIPVKCFREVSPLIDNEF